jgi:hypothetical protein
MVAPEVPTGGLVGQAVFDHQTDGHRHHTVGVMTLRQGHVGHIGVEVDVTSGATMDGVGKMDIVRAARDQISHVMQYPFRAAMPVGTMSAVGTGLPSGIAATLDDLRLGQILGARDALCGIGQILSRSWHGTALLGNALHAQKLPESSRHVITKTQY